MIEFQSEQFKVIVETEFYDSYILRSEQFKVTETSVKYVSIDYCFGLFQNEKKCTPC